MVFTPTVDDVRENYEMRLALEPLATELAARSILDENLMRLDEVVVAMRESGTQAEYQELNREFHRAIYAAAGRPRLYETIESLRDAFEAYIQLEAATAPDAAYMGVVHDQRSRPR